MSGRDAVRRAFGAGEGGSRAGVDVTRANSPGDYAISQLLDFSGLQD